MPKTRIIYQNKLKPEVYAKELGINYKKLSQVEKTKFQADHCPTLESKEFFRIVKDAGDGAKTFLDVRVRLNLKEMYFEIIDRKTEEVLHKGGKTKNHNILKTQAKEYLQWLGYNFSEENRKPKRTDLNDSAK